MKTTSSHRDALDLLELLRNRAMYGDNYNEDGPNLWAPSHWAAAGILIAAENHLACDHMGYAAPSRVSTVAEFTAQREYFAWCDSRCRLGGLCLTNGDMLQLDSSINQLGGLRPEWSPKFWQEDSK